MTSANDVIAAVMRGELDEDLDALLDAVIARRKNAARRRAASLTIGDRVRIEGISPKGMNGATGTVKGMRGKRVEVEIDKEFARFAGRFASMIESGLPLRVPDTCVVPA